MRANWKQDQRNLVCLTGGNDGVQITNMALNEEEIATQQQQADTEEATDNVPESEGTTLTTVTTRSPSYATIGTGGRGGRHGGRGAGRGRGQGRNAITCFRCDKRGHYA